MANFDKSKFEHLDEGRIVVRTGHYLSNKIGNTVSLHEGEHPTLKGRLAIRLAEHFGIVAADISLQEDRAGRSKLRLLEPHEVVDRAITIADLLVDELRERGDIVTIPNPWADEEKDSLEG